MLDELRVRLAEQGIGFEDYLRATERDESQIMAENRPDAERRVKTLLVLSEIAEKEDVEITDEELDADLARSRERYASNPAPRLVPRIAARPGVHAVTCCGARRRSSCWSIAGSSNIPSSRTCNICTTTTITPVTITPDTSHDDGHTHDEGSH